MLLGVFAFVNFSDALLLIRAQHLGLGVGSVIGVYCLYNLTYALASYPAGVVSDKIPRRIVVGCGLVIFACAYIGLGVISTTMWVWVLFPVYGLYTALTDGATKAWIVDLAPAADRGRVVEDRPGAAHRCRVGRRGHQCRDARLWPVAGPADHCGFWFAARMMTGRPIELVSSRV